MAYSALQMAEAFIQAGELNDALDALNSHLAENPADDTARRLRLAVLFRLDESEHLELVLEDISRLETPDADDLMRQARALQALGRLDAVVPVIHQALALEPENQRIAEQGLNLYIKLKNWLAALTLIEQQPKTWHWLQWRGDVLVHMGDDRGAITCYKESLQLLEAFAQESAYITGVKARLWITLGHAQRRVGLLAEADESYQAAQGFVPNDPTIVFYQGLVRALDGHIEQAAALCREGLAQTSAEIRDELVQALSNHASYRVLLPLL